MQNPSRSLRSLLGGLLSASLALSCGGSATTAPKATTPVATTTSAASAATGPVADLDVGLDPLIKKGTLSNGMTYYILPHEKPQKRAYLWLAVNAGSVQEDDDQQGLAHFDEHMAFNGTEHFPKSALVDYLEKIGMKFGADVNAYTTFEQTVFQLEVPTDDPKYIDQGLSILRDWAGGVSYDPVEVDKERGVVLEEWRLGRGAQARIFDKQAKLMFKGTRYADRLTIGQPEILKTAKRDTLARFYKDWYRPDLMAVIVVGDIKPEQIEAAIKSKFGDLKEPANPRQRVGGGIPVVHGTEVATFTDDEMPVTLAQVYSFMPKRRNESLGDYRRSMTEQLYDAMLDERLADLAHKPGAPFLFARTGFESATRQADSVSHTAVAKDGKIEEAITTMLGEVSRAKFHGFTVEEFDRAKKAALSHITQDAREYEATDGQEYANEITRNYFEKEQMPGRPAEAKIFADLLPTITLAEENQLAARIADQPDRLVLLSGGKSLKVPADAEIKGWVDHALATDPGERATDKRPETTTALTVAAPTPGKITKESTVDEVGVTEWTLSNGARVVIKPTTFQKDEIVMDGFALGGLSLATDKQFASARFADEIVGAAGLGSLDARALEKSLAGRVAHGSASIGEYTENVNGSSSTADLETMLQLNYLAFTAPRSDADAFANWKASQTEQLKNRRLDPGSVFRDDFKAFVAQNNPRRIAPTAADIEKVDPAEALAFYKERFANAGDFTFVFVGNLDLVKFRPLVEKYLASLPSTGKKSSFRDLKIEPVAGVKKFETALGQEPKSQVQMIFHDDIKWTQDAEHDAKLLSDVLSIRLREILREDMGGVYGVGAQGYIDRRPKDATHPPKDKRIFYIAFGCSPDNVDKLKEAALTEIKRLQKDGVSDEYLAKVRETAVREHEVAITDNRFWLHRLDTALEFGLDIKRIPDNAGFLGRITNTNLKAAAKKFLDMKQYVTGVLKPTATK